MADDEKDEVFVDKDGNLLVKMYYTDEGKSEVKYYFGKLSYGGSRAPNIDESQLTSLGEFKLDDSDYQW